MKNIFSCGIKSNKYINGVAALPTMLLIGGIIVEISIAGAFISYLFSQSIFGVKLSEEALSLAQSGIQDAIIKIIRNKDFSSTSGYDITIANKTAHIVVCKGSKSVNGNCNIQDNGKSEITSMGSILLKKRKLRATVNINSNTGEVKLESINEIAI